jgi:hypothetical protein
VPFFLWSSLGLMEAQQQQQQQQQLRAQQSEVSWSGGPARTALPDPATAGAAGPPVAAAVRDARGQWMTAALHDAVALSAVPVGLQQIYHPLPASADGCLGQRQ